MISKIKITNIKGFGTHNNEIEVNMLDSKINILVAPNGYGKTSITTAFKYVGNNGKRLEIPKELLYMKNETLHPVFSIEEDRVTYVSNSEQNQIAEHFNCQVINSLLKAETKSLMVPGYTKTKGILAVDEVVLGKDIKRQPCPYKVTEFQSNFGRKGRAFKDISEYFHNAYLLHSILELSDVFVKFKSKGRVKMVQDIITEIQNTNEGIRKIRTTVDLTQINKDEHYLHFSNMLKRFFASANDWDVFSAFLQLKFMFENHKDWLNKQCDFLEYTLMRSKLNANLNDFNSSWKVDLKSVVEDGRLKVKFPKADELSNGQRDVMAFIVQLMNVRNRLKASKKNIIVIDEIFDYMDDANLIAAQYYLTKYLDLSKSNLYVIILSHLDPILFKNYIFSSNKTNVCYLSKQMINLSDEMKAFLCFRNNLNTKEAIGKELYDNISKYYFHYNPTSKDLTGSVQTRPHLKTKWFKEDNLKIFLVAELNKYLSDQENFDPYAVCLAIRIRVEKLAYDLLPSKEYKDTFLAEHMTKQKLLMAEKFGVTIPDSYYVMGVIYNDAEHLHNVNNDKNCIYKLYNKVIKRIIKEFFDYKGDAIPLEYLK